MRTSEGLNLAFLLIPKRKFRDSEKRN